MLASSPVRAVGRAGAPRTPLPVTYNAQCRPLIKAPRKTVSATLRDQAAAWHDDIQASERLKTYVDDDQLLTDEQVDDLVDAAAGLISVIDDLRPLDRASFNSAYEVWRAIAAIPPGDRCRLLAEVEPGAIRSLWKASMARYVLDAERSMRMFEGHSVWDDMPREPGEVVTFDGVCERMTIEPGSQQLQVDMALSSSGHASTPAFRPRLGSASTPQHAFTQHFFMHPDTGLLFTRVCLKLWGPLDAWWLPAYARVDVGLTLTPVQADAGADLVVCYPTDGQPLELEAGDLPRPGWPRPRGAAASPFSLGPKDYVRPAGPGVYVGCGYRRSDGGKGATGPGAYVESDFVHFMLVKRV